jgi:hypothetical protein
VDLSCHLGRRAMVLVADAANGENSHHTADGRTYTEFSEGQAVIYNGRFTDFKDVNSVASHVYVGRYRALFIT